MPSTPCWPSFASALSSLKAARRAQGRSCLSALPRLIGYCREEVWPSALCTRSPAAGRDGRWGRGGAVRCRHRCPVPWQGALVHDASGPVFPCCRPGRAPSGPCRVLRKRSGRGRAVCDGGGAFLRRACCRGRRACPSADDRLAASAARRREDGRHGHRSQAMATTERGFGLWAADRLDDAMAYQHPAIRKTTCCRPREGALAGRIDARESWRMRRI